MSEDWKVGYKQAVLKAFVWQAGAITDGSYYASGRMNYERTYELREHLTTCTFDPEKMKLPVDSSWSEFMGTYFEGDTTRHGLDGYLTCQCGKYEDEHIRLQGTFGDLLQAILRED